MNGEEKACCGKHSGCHLTYGESECGWPPCVRIGCHTQPQDWEKIVDSWALQADMFKPEDFNKTVKPFIRNNFISKAEVRKVVEDMRPSRECFCGLFLTKQMVGYHSCGAFIGNTPSESEGITAYNRALSDLLHALHISEE